MLGQGTSECPPGQIAGNPADEVRYRRQLPALQWATGAGMAELADALALGASARKGVQVQVLFPAP